MLVNFKVTLVNSEVTLVNSEVTLANPEVMASGAEGMPVERPPGLLPAVSREARGISRVFVSFTCLFVVVFIIYF
jgi:hypothetical protein